MAFVVTRHIPANTWPLSRFLFPLVHAAASNRGCSNFPRSRKHPFSLPLFLSLPFLSASHSQSDLISSFHPYLLVDSPLWSYPPCSSSSPSPFLLHPAIGIEGSPFPDLFHSDSLRTCLHQSKSEETRREELVLIPTRVRLRSGHSNESQSIEASFRSFCAIRNRVRSLGRAFIQHPPSCIRSF